MKDYIEREADLKSVNRHYPNPNAMCAALVTVTAANVRPVKRGKWKPMNLVWGRSYYYCSVCEETVDMPTAMGIPMFRYCPHCGADMKSLQSDSGNANNSEINANKG